MRTNGGTEVNSAHTQVSYKRPVRQLRRKGLSGSMGSWWNDSLVSAVPATIATV